MAWKFIDNLRERLTSEESEQTRNRFKATESFFGKALGESGITPGLILTVLFGIYAVVNLVLCVLRIFS